MPFDSTPDQIKEAIKKLVREVHRNHLGREPRGEDEIVFKQTANPVNSSIKDLYFRTEKIGSLATTYILDIPRGINLDFTTYP